MEHVLKPFAIAVVFVLVALLWTFLLQHVIAYPFVFLFRRHHGQRLVRGHDRGTCRRHFFFALVGYFFIPPFYSMSMAKESQSFFTAFILCAIAITVVSSARKRAETAVRTARDELEVRVRERTRNWSNRIERSGRASGNCASLRRQSRNRFGVRMRRGTWNICNGHLLAYLGRPTFLCKASHSSVFSTRWMSRLFARHGRPLEFKKALKLRRGFAVPAEATGGFWFGPSRNWTRWRSGSMVRDPYRHRGAASRSAKSRRSPERTIACFASAEHGGDGSLHCPRAESAAYCGGNARLCVPRVAARRCL